MTLCYNDEWLTGAA